MSTKKPRAKKPKPYMAAVTLMNGNVVVTQTSCVNTATFLYSFMDGHYYDRVDDTSFFQRRKL